MELNKLSDLELAQVQGQQYQQMLQTQGNLFAINEEIKRRANKGAKDVPDTKGNHDAQR